MSNDLTYSVGALTRHLKDLIETDLLLQDVVVQGEVSNLTQHTSGHVYFTLKDDEAQLSCAMFKNVALQYLRRMPKHGSKILVRGGLSLYPPRGSYQLIVRQMQLAGEGDLHQRFLALKDKLQAEGLFDAIHKQPIPRFPRRIGVVTSPTGAVIRDIVDTIRRRFPHVEVVLAPTVVQGEAGAASIRQSLSRLQELPDLDVIILARGGGSLEDLWCFNEESVARAIHACTVPVISGVGHETDVTIADFVADLRAATPTAAAEQAVPNADDLRANLDQASVQLARNLTHFIEVRQQMLDGIAEDMEMAIQHQAHRIRQNLDHWESQMQDRLVGAVAMKQQALNDLEQRLESAALNMVGTYRQRLDVLAAQLAQFDHQAVLSRGYSITTHHGQPVLDGSNLAAGDRIKTYFAKGSVDSEVIEDQ
ncbi:MAG: exodeoxyribonuclease VII large subunit [Bacteroidia bacterium]